MRTNILCTLAVAAALLSPAVLADVGDAPGGAYGGLSLGASSFDLRDSAHGDDHRGSTVKLYGGYWLSEHFGAEIGFLRPGNIQTTERVGSADVEHTSKAYSIYAVGVARYRLTDALAIIGRLGIASNKVIDDGANVGSLEGTRRSLMAGIGAQYRVTPRISLTVDFDRAGKLSDRLSANTLSFGAQMSF